CSRWHYGGGTAQDGGRGAWRGGVVDQASHWSAGKVRRRWREVRRARAVLSRSRGPTHPWHGRCAVADRTGSGQDRSVGCGSATREASAQSVFAGRFSIATQAGKEARFFLENPEAVAGPVAGRRGHAGFD